VARLRRRRQALQQTTDVRAVLDGSRLVGLVDDPATRSAPAPRSTAA
jgi:hypothetical protein